MALRYLICIAIGCYALRNTTGRVKVQNMMTEEFAINKGLRQVGRTVNTII